MQGTYRCIMESEIAFTKDHKTGDLGIMIVNSPKNRHATFILKDEVLRLINDLQEEYKEELELYNLTRKIDCKKLNLEIIKIDHNLRTSGVYAVFKHNSKEYYASLCEVPFTGIECMIFNSKNGEVTNWGEVAEFHPYKISKEVLIECIEVFCGEGD